MTGLAQLRACCERMESQIQEQSGLSEAQCGVLFCMPDVEAITTGELCVEAGLSPSRGGRIVEELVQLGLVERQTGGRDRRIANLVLSGHGRKIKGRLDSLLQACERDVASRLSSSELEIVRSGLALLTRAMTDDSTPLTKGSASHE